MAPKTILGYKAVDGSLKSTEVSLPDLQPHQVLIKITHSGLCGTDLAVMPYGLALGHEGVGVVAELGSKVTSFHVGDRVGSGYQRDSCGNCKYCLSGNEIWCLERNIYAEKDFQNGTFSQYYAAAETFVYKIPENMSSEVAAPLQCAGATVYSALVKNIKFGDRVGILGIGGLGHLAIQFASKLGAEVVVFSTSASKEDEAKRFGATEFVLLKKPDEVKKPLDVLLLSGNQYPDFEAFCNPKVLARQAIIVPLSAPHGDLKLPGLPLFFNGYKLHTSLVANRLDHAKMLDFAARQGIKPTLERFDLTEKGLSDAIKKLQDGKMRYRGVLVAKD